MVIWAKRFLWGSSVVSGSVVIRLPGWTGGRETRATIRLAIDSEAAYTFLGGDAVSALGLKSRHIMLGLRMRGYKPGGEPVALLPGYLLLKHKRPRLARFTDITQFWLAFAVAPESVVYAAEPTDSSETEIPESLLGRDATRFLTRLKDNSGESGEFDWERYVLRRGTPASPPRVRGGYRIRTIRSEEYLLYRALTGRGPRRDSARPTRRNEAGSGGNLEPAE